MGVSDDSKELHTKEIHTEEVVVFSLVFSFVESSLTRAEGG